MALPTLLCVLAGTASGARIMLKRDKLVTDDQWIKSYETKTSPLERWTSQYEEDAVEPELPIFDPHHHLYNEVAHDGRQNKHMPLWQKKVLFAFKAETVNKMFTSEMPDVVNTFGPRFPMIWRFEGDTLLQDINASGRGHNVVGTMAVEAGWQDEHLTDPAFEAAGELDMFTETHERYPKLCQGVIPFADLRLGAGVETVLQHYAQSPLVKGIRHSLAYDNDGHYYSSDHCDNATAYDPAFREGFALLSKYDFSYDTWLYSQNLEGLVDLARSFPNTTIICDHIGMPLGVGREVQDETTESTLAGWKRQIRLLAAESNVYVKVGGLGMPAFGFPFHNRTSPPSSDELAVAWGPLVLFTIETFGVERCMMESNFPMDKASTSYTVLFNALKKIVRSYSTEDKHKLFELNAKRIYRI